MSHTWRVPTEPPQPPRITSEDVERFGDEEQMRSASDEGRLRDERPPHHD